MATTSVTYVGPFDAVDIDISGTADLEVMRTVRHGDSIEVDAALASSLLEQVDNWQPTEKKAKPASKEQPE